jgi:hypothetical protein
MHKYIIILILYFLLIKKWKNVNATYLYVKVEAGSEAVIQIYGSAETYGSLTLFGTDFEHILAVF